MDDDYFGGFEAAEIFKDGNGEPQITSPAIPWAAFSAVPEIPVPPTIFPELLPGQDDAPACFAPPEPFASGRTDVPADPQLPPSTLSLAEIKDQVPDTKTVSSLSLVEDQGAAVDIGNDTETKLRLHESEKHLQQTLSALEAKLKAADEEKSRIKKELEEVLEKYRTLETDFLKEKENKLISQQDIYNKLQEKHKLELEDLRRAGHDALSIIVEEFKAQLQAVVQEQEEAFGKQQASAVEKQAQRCEGLLVAQHQRLLEMLEKEHKILEEKTKDSLFLQAQEYKEMLEKCMKTEKESNKEALAAAVKTEKEELQAAVLAAVTAEREHMTKRHEQEKELWQAERNKDQERIAQAIEEAMEGERQSSQEMVKSAILEEQRKTEIAVGEAVKRTREELMDYVKEQKRLDQVLRQRSLSSLELFLSCAQKQLSCLLQEETTASKAEGMNE